MFLLWTILLFAVNVVSNSLAFRSPISGGRRIEQAEVQQEHAVCHNTLLMPTAVILRQRPSHGFGCLFSMSAMSHVIEIKNETNVNDRRTDDPSPSVFPTVSIDAVDSQSIPDASMPTPTQSFFPATPSTISESIPTTHNQVLLMESMEQLLCVMDGHNSIIDNNIDNDDPLVIIKYYANYCKICQRAGIQYKKLSQEYSPNNNVVFVKVEQSILKPPAADTLRSLGVNKFPFIQIYRKGQCVASFSTGPSHMFMKRVRDTLNLCLERTPEEWNVFVNEFQTEINENIAARQRLTSESLS